VSGGEGINERGGGGGRRNRHLKKNLQDATGGAEIEEIIEKIFLRRMNP